MNTLISMLHVTFLYAPPPALAAGTLERPQGSRDEFFLEDQTVFLFCPDGYGNSKLSNTFFEKNLAVAATTRNWNTVNALYQLAQVAL